MSGQRAPLETALGRIAACLLAVATMAVTALIVAPTATADPQAEAAAAITAAYDASGGPEGPLGPPDGGVYPIGEGFAHNYARGKMFFTPATGAHFMQGEILAKYEALGGPTDSDLGFPTLSESPGRLGPDSRNVIFSAADRPVIFWTPETGARVVRGAINLAWDRLGGSSGVLGAPAEDEAYRGDVLAQRFTGGEITWNRKTGEFTTVPPELVEQLADLDVPDDPTSAINAARRAAGGALGPLGARDGAEYPIGDDGVAQNFTGGTIFYSPATGANVLTGQVLEKYQSVGGPEGDLGFPTSGERDGGVGASRMAGFAAEDDPVIFWTPDYGAVIVRGPMKAAWDELGGAAGELGVPMDDQTESGDEVTQRFSGGSISWNRSDGSFATEPANLASQLAGLEVPGAEPPPEAAETPVAQSDDGGSGFSWSRSWWLLVLIPVLVLAAALIALTVWNRRRRSADVGYEQYDDHYDAAPDDEFDGPYQPSMVGAEAPDDEITTRYSDHYAEPLGDRSAVYGLGTPPAQSDSTVWGYPGDQESSEAPAESAVTSEDFAEPEYEDGDYARVDDGPEVKSPPVPAGDMASEIALEDPFFDEDQDDVDTAPTPVAGSVVAGSVAAGSAADALNPDNETTGRHAAIDVDEPEPQQTALRLPLDGDPRRAPEGYPVKARVTDGLYWSPDSASYDEVDAELWFASEELARTNGFVRSG
ncbi:LGFP repeat-containing protein [Mycolicibacterium thermoresistibile]